MPLVKCQRSGYALYSKALLNSLQYTAVSSTTMPTLQHNAFQHALDAAPSLIAQACWFLPLPASNLVSSTLRACWFLPRLIDESLAALHVDKSHAPCLLLELHIVGTSCLLPTLTPSLQLCN
jgi:hypothetical protein